MGHKMNHAAACYRETNNNTSTVNETRNHTCMLKTQQIKYKEKPLLNQTGTNFWVVLSLKQDAAKNRLAMHSSGILLMPVL